jgi:DNA-binding NarL/FixJ family response regulator
MDDYPVLIVAPKGRVRAGLQALLMAMPQVDSIDLADDIPSALSSERVPVLVLLDLEGHRDSIADALEAIRAQWPDVRCLVLANSVQDQQIAKSVGADDVLLKGFPTARLFESVRGLIATTRVARILD